MFEKNVNKNEKEREKIKQIRNKRKWENPEQTIKPIEKKDKK